MNTTETAPKMYKGSELLARAPKGAKAAIVAELHEDQSDSSSDYHGHRTVRRVVIGWRMIDRESFPALRKAAATFPETEHLGPGKDVWRFNRVWTEDGTLGHGERVYKGNGVCCLPRDEVRELLQSRVETPEEAQEIEGRLNSLEPDKTLDGVPYRFHSYMESVEHRENYSMGAGNYLKAGYRDSDGWSVESERLSETWDYEYHEPSPWPTKIDAKFVVGMDMTKEASDKLGYIITTRTHTKKGHTYYQVELKETVTYKEWERLTASAKTMGGWYSKAWQGIPGGFAFKEWEAACKWAAQEFPGPSNDPTSDGPRTEEAAQFARDHLGETIETPFMDAVNEAVTSHGKENVLVMHDEITVSVDFRRLADDIPNIRQDIVRQYVTRVQDDMARNREDRIKEILRARGLSAGLVNCYAGLLKEIDNLSRDHRENTPKRQREGMSRRIKRDHAQRAADTLEILFAAAFVGELPWEIRDTCTSKAALLKITQKQIKSEHYYHVAETDEWSYQTTDYERFRNWIASRKTGKMQEADAKRAKDEEIRRAEEAVKFANIPGFFPTPGPVIDRMLELAEIEPGKMSVLEPSAGKGDIADAVRALGVRCTELHCVEINNALADICEAKGHSVVRQDFTNLFHVHISVDRVLMNPPFENGQAETHIRLAYTMLKPGGRLVAVVPSNMVARPSSISRDSGRLAGWFEWAEEVGAEWHDLPAASFKDGFVSTNVSTALIVIDKPKD